MLKTLFALLAFTLMLRASAQDAPNIILILADDQGWNGTSVPMDPDNDASKSDFYETPSLERLAAAGMRFSQAYAPSPKCSPSRMSIISGKTTARNKFTDTNSAVSSDEILTTPASLTSITDAELTLPEYLKSLTGLDYTTAHFGKWHLGSDDPMQHGYDASDGANSNNDGSGGASVGSDPKKIFSITQSGIDFMDAAISDDQPFYLQLSHYAVHTGIESTQSALDKYTAKLTGSIHDNAGYAAMTEDLDDALGLILDYIQEKQIGDNTYIIYTSDNGGQLNVTSNEPLKLGKTMIFEGGIRVPFVVAGPDIMANSHSSEPIIGYDFFPTFVDLIGGDLSALPADLDGVSFKNLLEGNENAFSREEPLFFHSPHYTNNANKVPRSAIIDGDHKLLVEYETGDRLYYHLADDISESSNLFNTAAALSRDLVTTLRDYLRSVDAAIPEFSAAGTDTDGDELPDAWEFEYLLGALYAGADDPDGDGLTNMQEYNNGTDPLVSNETVLSNIDDLKALRVYPNPTQDFVTFVNDQAGDFQFILFSMDGKIALSQSGQGASDTIDLQQVPKGIYGYRISFGPNESAVDGRLIIH